MTLVLVESSWLWLLLLVPLFWFLPHRATNRGHAAIRSVVVTLLILALARPALLTSQNDPYHVIVWDRSESVGRDTAAAVEDLLEGPPDTSRIHVIALNGARKNVPKVGKLEPVSLDGSSMSRALAFGARLIPEGSDGAITVVSDGMATDRQWGDAVRQLVERKVPVHTVTVAAPENEVYPSAIRTRPPLRIGQTTKLMVDVVGSAEQAVVTLLSGEELLARSARFACEGRTAVELEFEPSRSGLLDVVASVQVVSGTDINPDNNQFVSALAVQEPIRALYLSERLTNSREKMRDLLGRGVDLSELSQANLNNLAENPDGISTYDLVVIDDRPAETIPLAVQEAIVKAVQEEGVGLFYAGGKGVFGTGGYFDTPVASILPVEMIQKEEKRDPSTTLVVIIDTSGSMTGERVQLAKECARLAIRRLLPHDKVGIVEFYGTKQWAAPIQSAANAIDIQRAINRLDAGGGTVILPAIEEAFYAMQNVQTRYKHVLVLTDGGVESGNFESLMRRMAAKGITVSTVLVGSDAHSEFLVNIANWGKGHFYCASSRFNIPEILLKQPSTSKIPSYRPGLHFVSMGGPSGWWGEIPRPEEPRLSGYVETRLRPGAQVAVETETERHPVLASWRYGLGRVSAFTTEPVGEGTAPWREWDGYGAWLLRVLSRTSREHSQPFAYTIERSPTDARVVAQRLTPRPYLPMAERLDGDGTAGRLVFQQRSPDVFTATVLEGPGKTIHLRAGAGGWPGRMAHLVSPAWHAVAPEHNVDPARAVDLALLASVTGGRNVSIESISRLDPAPGGMGTAKDLYRLWPWCLILGLLAYLGDLLFRRWPGSMAAGEKKLGLLCLMIGFVLVSASDVKAEVSAGLEAQLQEALQEDPFRVDDGQLYRAALLEDEALEPLLARLDDVIQDDENAFEALWLTASLKWRYGNLDQALALFERAAAIKAEPLVLFRVAQLLDAGGKTGEAVGQYLKTLEAKPDDDLAERIQLRLALLKSTATEVEQVQVDLAAYAKGRDQAFQNRAGVVLALAGKPKEALALYKPARDGNQRFKQFIRLAEWAMAAEDMAQAQASAWDALQSAKLKRDRRYALTVLAESYRRDEKLEKLIERFAATPELSAEARMTWIDLLREQGDADKALELFEEAKAKADGGDVFTADMRRELLEICREAGRDDLLIENLREMIAKEPRRPEWRSGLCRFHLERGERDKGQAVWADYQEQAQRGDWLAAASATMELGLDELAQSFAENLIRTGQGKERLAALQFLFDLHKARGREDDMRAVLTRMDELATPDASQRARLAESWEQLGRQDKAAEVLEKLRAARGPDNFSSDLETRLAWLYSETGAEEKAYEAWKRTWLHIDSPGRRRYIEDRFMATASRLGKLADIAIDLEEKLAEGTANKRDSALLVRLYTKVGDPVSASEIIHDFMKLSGGAEIQMLEEQALVYVMCNDYYHYEITLRKLMRLDPGGSPEYLTQLAMSALERGRNDEARAILNEMRGLEANPASAEFEAGVLKIAGMHEEATAAYWRGIARHPDRIDAYLLLGRTLQMLGKGPQATGLFQYLVENADEDDLFTIAVDGLLNMNNPRQGSRLAPETLRWARRAILERLAARDDKVYLFQLLSDVSEDLRDRDMMIRALSETLPIAGERRTPQLRELMELARVASRDKDGVLRFGRRLVGMGEIIPPQVYLELGSIFLDSGDIRNAARTFDKADGGLDQGGYQRKVAETFDQKRYIRSALRSYEQLLITAPDDPTVLVKVGELKELLGRDAEAAIAYRRALDVLIGGQPLFSFKGDKSAASRSNIYYFSRNVDPFDRYYMRVLTGFLATADPGGKAVLELIDDSLEALGTDLELVHKERAAAKNTELATLANVPRIARRSRLISRLALADGHLGKALAMEQLLLETFPEDKTLLPDICSTWDSWGYGRRARDLVSAVPTNPGREQAWQVLGEGENDGARQVFRLILSGDRAGARARLRDLEKVLGERGTAEEINLLFTIAQCLKDPVAAERLARFAINKAPGDRKLLQSIQMLTRAFPYLDERQRARLVDYVESLLERQGESGANGVLIYHYSSLKRLTGKDLKLPLTIVRPQVEKLLAMGNLHTRYLTAMFAFLNEEDFHSLLRETYRKAQSSDRLAIVFGLIRQYPGKMDPATEGLFIELAEEAAGTAMDDPLNIYQALHSYYDNTADDANAGVEARLLEKFAEGKPQEKRMGYLVEQVRVCHRGGETQRGMEAAGRLLSLAVRNDKAFNTALSLQRELPSSYLVAFLAAMDKIEQENGSRVDLEKRRVLLVREARNPGRLLSALREAIRKFPKELSFRQELRQELENQGRHHEAIKVLKGLIALEPDNRQHLIDLQAAWTRLAHPFKARAVMHTTAVPRPAATKRAVKPVSATTASRPSSPRPAKPPRGDEKTARGTREAPLEKPSTQLIKQHYEAGDLDAARLGLRRLWRRFSALDRASQSPIYRSPGAAHTRYYEWPGPQPRQEQKATAPNSPDAGMGGLRAFLAMEPLTSPHGRPANPAPPSVFSAIGSEEFAARELRTWLRTFDPQNYQTPLFREILREVVKQRISEQGLEPFLNDAIARFTKDELSVLDQHALLAALGLHPEAGGEAADLFLDAQLETLEPDNLWKMLRMARCFLKRGNEEAALSIYQWCGADFSHWSRFSYSSQSVNPAVLVEEIRKNLGGASRVRVLGKVLPLITPNSHGSSLQSWSPLFVLSTWAREVAPHEVYQRCPDICREVVRANGAEWDKHSETLELATLFLAAGGNTEEALDGLKLLLPPPAKTRTSSSRNKQNRDYLLQKWLPEDMTSWSHADQWLSGIVECVGQWETERKLPTADAVKIMSLVAVRQHQNGFEDSARATLDKIGKLSLTNPNATIWFSDAAEITGNQVLAQEIATTLLKQRRLPIVRIAPLMEAVVQQQGVPAALQLAEDTLEYTWEHGFLQTMTKICTAAGDQKHAKIWKDRQQQALNPDYKPAAATDEKAEKDYRRLREASQAKQHVKVLELGEALLAAHPEHPEIAAALHLAAKAGMASSNFKRAAPLFRRILEDHPDFNAIDEVRFKLAQSLSGMRALEECIKQCRENLESAPESPGADYWRFLIPQSQFRLWRFKEAEEGLKTYLARYPRSDYAGYAERYLEKINPSWQVDENGIGEYSGKYEQDYRLKAALAALPGHIREGREMIRERLGVDIDFQGNVNFIFRDAGPDKRGGFMAETFTISRGYKPVTVIQLYAEHVVIDPAGYRATVIHEMKHAGFKVLMGRAYDDVPDWITEGLAQWAADQGESRMISKLNSETFAGKDPVSRMNGVANPAHDVGDYLEDILAFEWLEKQKEGSVKAFRKGLIKGEKWEELLAATSGLETDETLRRMDRYCRDRVVGELGPAGRDALGLRDTLLAKGAQGSEALKAWLREEGNRQFAEWVDKHPGHVLEPVFRFYRGRGLILTGEFTRGREWLRGGIESQEWGSLRDDALFWEGYAFQQEKRMADAARSFGILLRDYSWSNSSPKVRGKFEPAGPELKPPSHPTGTDQ